MKRYYNAVDLLRFFAAALVLVHHIAAKAWSDANSFPAKIIGLRSPVPFFSNWGEPGWVGVQIFFVVSGIVIANSAVGRSPASFAIGRAARLYPAVLACAPLALICSLLTDAADPNWQLSLVRSVILSPKGPWVDPVYWTLGVEMIFYGIVFIWTSQRRVSLELLAIALTIWSAFWVISILAGFKFGLGPERITLLRFGSFFSLGIFLWSRSERRDSPCVRIFSATALVICLFEISIKSEIHLKVNYNSVAPLIIWLIAVYVLTLSLAESSHRRSTWMFNLGKMTYPLYLCHTTVAGGVMYAAGRMGVNSLIAFALGCAIAISLAWCLATYWEPVAARFLKRKLEHALRR